MMLPAVSQTTSKNTVSTLIDKNGDTLIVMGLTEAKLILKNLLECEINDSIIEQYTLRDSLNNEKIIFKDNIIENLTEQNNNKDVMIENYKLVIVNNEDIINKKDIIISEQKDEIERQIRLKRLGLLGSVTLPIIVLFLK